MIKRFVVQGLLLLAFLTTASAQDRDYEIVNGLMAMMSFLEIWDNFRDKT